MQKRGRFFTVLVLLAACGSEEGLESTSPSVQAVAETPDQAPDEFAPAPKALTAAPSDHASKPATTAVDGDAWRTRLESTLVQDRPPPKDNAFLARAAEDRQRLDEILDRDLRADRARVRTLQRRLSLQPKDAALRFQLAEFYYLNDLPNLAELELLNLLELEPENFIAHKYLADIYLQSGSQGRSIYHARRAHHGNPDDASVLYLWGWTLRDGGDIERARDVAQVGLEIDPNNANVLSLMALLAMDAGDDPAAEAFARRAVQNEPDHIRAHSLLGLALSNLGRDYEAEAELLTHRRLQILNSAKLLHVKPPLGEAERAAALAAYHMHVGNLDYAYNELERSFALEPGNPAALTMKARLLVLKGDEKTAIAVLEQALIDFPGDHRVERALGSVLATCKDEALRDYDRAATLASGLLPRGGSKDFEVMYTLGVAEAALGYSFQARQHLRAALKLEPGNPMAAAALAELDPKGVDE